MSGSVNESWKTRFQELLEDGNINILLGAGASAGYFSLLGDIENLITEIEEGNANLSTKTSAKAILLAAFFRGVIEKNIQLLENHKGLEITKRYARFLRQLNRLLIDRNNTLLSKEVNIFTTNVDLAIELAADEMGQPINDGFTGRFNPVFSAANYGSLRYRRTPREGKISEDATLNLVKLHGSVSWRAPHPDNQQIRFDRQLEIIRKLASDHARVIRELPECPPETVSEQVLAQARDLDPKLAKEAKSFVSDYSQVTVVNPTKEKFEITVIQEIYYELLRQFSNELERENALLLAIGFSFRDEHIRSLVIRAARSNPTLQVLVFGYKPANGDEIRALLPPSLVPNSNIHVICPEPDEDESGEDSDEPVRIDLDWVTKYVLATPMTRPKP